MKYSLEKEHKEMEIIKLENEINAMERECLLLKEENLSKQRQVKHQKQRFEKITRTEEFSH